VYFGYDEDMFTKIKHQKEAMDIGETAKVNEVIMYRVGNVCFIKE
jgi:hypothetical protein